MRGGLVLGAVCALTLLGAGISGSPGGVLGAAVGLLVGGVYAATLLIGIRQMPRLGPVGALRAVQIGSIVRLGFAMAAFALAARLLPQANLAWAAATALLPLIWSLVRVGRQGVRA
ncbi:MAG TPA: hypothetical protein VNM16_01330 [Bacillota bacterium]|nr:hypothetical protein [Bacillota bacterium]